MHVHDNVSELPGHLSMNAPQKMGVHGVLLSCPLLESKLFACNWFLLHVDWQGLGVCVGCINAASLGNSVSQLVTGLLWQ